MYFLNFFHNSILKGQNKNIFFFSKYNKKEISLKISKKFGFNFSQSIERKSLFNEVSKLFFLIPFNYIRPVFSEKSTQNQSKIGLVTKNGLKVITFSEGLGRKPDWGDFIQINYVIYLLTGENVQKIDSTYERHKTFVFRHGSGQVITGIEETVHDMKLGEKRRVIIPASLGYINTVLGPIPPFNLNREKLLKKNNGYNYKNRDQLVFDIEIINIKKNIT